MKHPGRMSIFQKEVGDLPSENSEEADSHRRGQKLLKGTRLGVKLCPLVSFL